jgi:hypothetical protein
MSLGWLLTKQSILKKLMGSLIIVPHNVIS